MIVNKSNSLLLLDLAYSFFSSRPKLYSSPVFDPIQPPSYPLAVRNPYLSTWIPGALVADLPSSTPQFWSGNSLTWGIIARVDGTAYNLFGIPDKIGGTSDAPVVSASYTSTHSVFTLVAGSATFKLDFFTPVSPSNYVRQSLPFSYLTVFVSDSQGSNVQVYSDIDDTWTGQSSSTSLQFEDSDDTSVFTLSAKDAFTYSQNADDMALWGDVIFASRPSNSSKLTVGSELSSTTRGQFVNQGALSEVNTTTNATINSQPWTEGNVVGLSHDLGDVTSETSVTFAVGYVRDDAINYLGRSYTGYYRATYEDTFSAVSHFLDDYDDAEAESVNIDAKISSAAEATAGSNYTDIVALSLRQSFGGIDITIPTDTLDTDGVLGFIKEISSDGNVNTVDVIMPAFPLYYAIEPEYIRLLIDPVIQYLATGAWKAPWVIHDIGSNYPNATGHDDQVAEEMPIEETGNLMMLAYAYVLASGNTAWAEPIIPLLQHYADYLVFNSINIADQLSTNDAAGPLPNETNLAVKAAVGLKAFGVLSGLQNYSDIGDQHANLIYDLGLGTDRVIDPTHVTLEYPNNKTTFKIIFNLYPDVLLSLNTFDPAVFTTESTYLPTVHQPGGIPLDNRQDWSKTDWLHWVAGYCSNSTRDLIVNDIWRFVSNGLNTFPFSDRYIVSADQGGVVGSEFALKARPTVGGHFALLALNGANSLKLDTDSTVVNSSTVSANPSTVAVSSSVKVSATGVDGFIEINATSSGAAISVIPTSGASRRQAFSWRA